MHCTSRDHVELRKTVQTEKSSDTNETSTVEIEFMDVSEDQNEPPTLQQEPNHNLDDLPTPEIDFEAKKQEISIQLFTSIQKTKIMHSVANEAIDEILQAMQEASRSSNALLKHEIGEVFDAEKIPG